MNKRILSVIAIIAIVLIALMAKRSYAPVRSVPADQQNPLPNDAGAPDMGVLE
jgi:hypothetical protein